ncbi:hypothetical protein [Vibrio owensii]|uniref:hypothetical protein n=1 Tax=Vibrio owensii TaxID=696485 RepID=UPI0018F17EE4|nr:hypothetical protein [Vibrio owensii]
MHKSNLSFHAYKNELSRKEFATVIKTITLWATITALSLCLGYFVTHTLYPEFNSTPTLELPPQLLIIAYTGFFITANVAAFLGFILFASIIKRTINANLPPWLAILTIVPGVGTIYFLSLFIIDEEWASNEA